MPSAAEPAAEDDPWAADPAWSVFGATDSGAPATAPSEEWSTTSEDAWADAPPPPPPPPPGLEVDDAAWAEAPPPPPPPPPDFDHPSEQPADTAASFGGLSGPAVPDLDEAAEGENPWLAELDENGETKSGDRSRFGRRR